MSRTTIGERKVGTPFSFGTSPFSPTVRAEDRTLLSKSRAETSGPKWGGAPASERTLGGRWPRSCASWSSAGQRRALAAARPGLLRAGPLRPWSERKTAGLRAAAAAGERVVRRNRSTSRRGPRPSTGLPHLVIWARAASDNHGRAANPLTRNDKPFPTMVVMRCSVQQALCRAAPLIQGRFIVHPAEQS